MTIVGFNILNPKIDNKKPFYNSKKNIFYFKVDKPYKYYIEVSNTKDDDSIEYCILLSTVEFDENCRKCSVDLYGRCQIHPLGEFKNYIKRECTERGNINCNYYWNVELAEGINYDVYCIE